MAIPASKIRAVCSSSETALVRASRKPVLEELSPAELKRNAARAKKLYDKWQDLSRTHARARSEKVGFGETDANTQLKAEIFGEALKNYEARIAKLGSTKGSAAKSAGSKTKKDRNIEHRASRAAVRKGMSAVEDLLNVPARKKKAATALKGAPAPIPSGTPAAEGVPTVADAPAKVTKPKKSKAPGFASPAALKAAPPTKLKVKGLAVTPAGQRKALTAAKKSRVVRSGKTTRTLGHVVARGKRAQARRDSKG